MAEAQPSVPGEEEAHSRAQNIPPPAAMDAGAVLQQLAAAMATIAGGARVGPQPQVQTGSNTLERFRRMKPPTYDGAADTEVAEQFLEECELILGAMEIVKPSTRITLTAFQLVGRASAWWSSRKASADITQ